MKSPVQEPKLIEIKSDIPEAYYNLGILLSNSGVFAEAIQCQKKH